MKGLPVTIEAIRDAAAAIAGAIAHSPIVPAPGLSDLAGAEIYLKLETLHRTGSFKERGALNKLLTLNASERRAGVVAMSAGNHAQGVAYHARRLGIPATIVMPEGTPFIKIDRTEAYGARVVLKGDSLSAARQAADALAREQDLTLVHPYDDPAVIAGQGTIALELLADRPDLDTIVVPIGGGGLISGIAVAAKALNPEIEIVGVQSSLYPSMYRLISGEDTGPLAAAATLAEGIAVEEPGRLTRHIVKALVADILLVDDVTIKRAIETLLGQKLVVEGAGAAGVAAVLAVPRRFRGRRVGIVMCGGNIDARLLASILMRGLVREGRLVRLRSQLPDVPGSLSRLSGVIGKHGGNIVEVHHQRLFHDTSVKRAGLEVVVETQNRRHVEVLIDALAAAGFPTQLLSNGTEGAGGAEKGYPAPATGNTRSRETACRISCAVSVSEFNQDDPAAARLQADQPHPVATAGAGSTAELLKPR
jgi:threonine dehydratase